MADLKIFDYLDNLSLSSTPIKSEHLDDFEKQARVHNNTNAPLVCITLGARDFSSAVSGFCQVFIVTRAKSFAARGFGLRPTPKIPAASEKNPWYPGYGFSCSKGGYNTIH